MGCKIKLNIQLFASKTVTKTIEDSYGNDYKVTVQVNESLPSDYIETNGSTLSGSVKVSNTGSGGAYSSSKDMSATITFKNDNSSGSQISKKSGSCAFNFDGSSTITATPLSFSGVSVPHNDDGSKKIYYTMTLKVSTTSLAQTVTMTGTLDLTTIPRGSVINNTSYNPENANRISITKYVDSYFDKLEIYTTNEADEEVLLQTYSGIENDYVITSKSNLDIYYDSNANRQNAKVILKLYTYSNSSMSTLIGTDVKEYTNQLTTPPTFTDFDYADENATTSALTGDTSIIVKGYSNVKVDIPTDKKAVGNKGATIKSYNVNGTLRSYADPFTYTINSFNANELIVYAIDSRNLSTRVSKPINLKNYSKLVKLSNDASRENDVGTQVTFNLNGTYWNDTFGAVQNDLSATYRYKVSGGSWQTGTSEIALTKSGNNYSFSGVLKGDAEDLGFDIGNSYNVEIVVKDKLSSVTFSYLIGASQPAIAILKNKVALGGVYDESIDKKSQIYDAYITNADLIVGNIESKNLCPGLVIGVGLNSTTGVQTVVETKATSNYVPIDFNANPVYTVSGLTDQLYSFAAAYNSNYEFLGRTGGSAKTYFNFGKDSFKSGTAQGTGDIAYLRITQYEVQEINGTISLVNDLNVQLETGSKATSFSPHIAFNGERLDLSGEIAYRDDITYGSKALKLYKSGNVMQLVGSLNSSTQFVSEDVIATIPYKYVSDIIRFYGVGDSGGIERFNIETDGSIKCLGTGYWKGFSVTWLSPI